MFEGFISVNDEASLGTLCGLRAHKGCAFFEETDFAPSSLLPLAISALIWALGFRVWDLGPGCAEAL